MKHNIILIILILLFIISVSFSGLGFYYDKNNSNNDEDTVIDNNVNEDNNDNMIDNKKDEDKDNTIPNEVVDNNDNNLNNENGNLIKVQYYIYLTNNNLVIDKNNNLYFINLNAKTQKSISKVTNFKQTDNTINFQLENGDKIEILLMVN